ncbi:MAG: Tryptophan--tRNA ligase, mitochondrial [Peltula sp. TS41687]|nr:MAG: Tryptophan--tRNA ligase, mitochondrial [Peltula sp. TS41687]
MLTSLGNHARRRGHWNQAAKLHRHLHQASSSPTNHSGSVAARVIFSGIQPTGIPHLGNYLGALRQWVRLQDDEASSSKLLYSVVDLHAITVRQDAEELRRRRRETLATLLAIGLNPDRSVVFFQSDVCPCAYGAHVDTQLYGFNGLSVEDDAVEAIANVEILKRFFQSKLSLPEDAGPSDNEARAKLRLGLFAYPVLQAADVLLHRATHVPVGKDQTQHLEFARECATNFNHAHGRKILPLPETILSPANRVMSLKQPHLKMSKSHPDPNSRILLTDTPEDVKQKIRLAMTDSEPGISYDLDGRPGVSNLLDIWSYLDEEGRSPETLAKECGSLSLRQFKEEVSERVISSLAGIKDAYDRVLIRDDGRYIDHVAAKGAEKARESAEETMVLVREAVGI